MVEDMVLTEMGSMPHMTGNFCSPKFTNPKENTFKKGLVALTVSAWVEFKCIKSVWGFFGLCVCLSFYISAANFTPDQTNSQKLFVARMLNSNNESEEKHYTRKLDKYHGTKDSPPVGGEGDGKHRHPDISGIYTLHQDISLKYDGANYSLFNIDSK
ncbi:hypothetical protein TURU_081111 [Turdus rufiventris]|nr:hypothetical protein TURU_081111 [Turdus rufiventris]